MNPAARLDRFTGKWARLWLATHPGCQSHPACQNTPSPAPSATERPEPAPAGVSGWGR